MHSLTLRFLASHSAGLHVGTRINGGSVLHWVDEAGLACATGWAKGHCVTALISGARFERPVFAGDLIEVQARLAYTGKTSMGIVRTTFVIDAEGVIRKIWPKVKVDKHADAVLEFVKSL